MMTSASSASLYELVPPPAPNTVARPATLGACQVRLQLSMLLLCITERMNFCAMKFSSLVALEQLNMPKELAAPWSMALWKPLAAASSASSHVVIRRFPDSSRTIGSVSRLYFLPILTTTCNYFNHLALLLIHLIIVSNASRI